MKSYYKNIKNSSELLRMIDILYLDHLLHISLFFLILTIFMMPLFVQSESNWVVYRDPSGKIGTILVRRRIQGARVKGGPCRAARFTPFQIFRRIIKIKSKN